MKKSLAIGSCVALGVSLCMGSGPIVADNADLLRVSGHAEVELVNGTLIQKDFSHGGWTQLFSRNQGSLKIEVNAPAGTYQVETWSIATDPMFPQRVHHGFEVVIGEGNPPNGPPFDPDDLMALMEAWGPCSGECPYDLNGDGVVNVTDLLIMLGDW